MNRTVSPELLDSLPADAPAAQHSRRDLRWFNKLLGNQRWWRRVLSPDRLAQPAIEIGSGDGQLAKAFGLDALDLQPAPSGWSGPNTWHQTDANTFAHWDEYPVVVSNLFLHHLSADQLAALGTTWNHSAVTIVASEPWRARGFRTGFSALCWLIRAHEVSRHDGKVSVVAGFRGEELPQLLQLDPTLWEWRISHSLLGMYRMIAQKRASQ